MVAPGPAAGSAPRGPSERWSEREEERGQRGGQGSSRVVPGGWNRAAAPLEGRDGPPGGAEHGTARHGEV